ncbi:unnamed protein product [Ranitomeya imitator]|uniref:LRAT domain-containing protein n=1 Tax=Ranitomeya imitator TaxID=111125 RepID=A0ABN9MMT6_9NEOB|nr:unnamed protein product [Ranitomeya imitator]
MPYSVTRANCEHFATELRYGKGFSDQYNGIALQFSISFPMYRQINSSLFQVANAAVYTAVGGGIFAAVLAAIAVVTRSRRQNQ